MQEIKSNEVHETKAPEVENYKNIQPENGMTVSESKDFWNQKFEGEAVENDDSEFGGKYNSYEKRLGCVPVDGETGKFEGERGNSKFIPLDETDRGAACKEKLAEYGKDGIEYKNLEPDFSEVSEGTVKIDNMTFALPLRSHIKHEYAFITDEINSCGVDYSKAVIITNAAYIDTTKQPRIRPNEYKVLANKERTITKEFTDYLLDYKDAVINNADRRRYTYKYCTLQYFHKELGLE